MLLRQPIKTSAVLCLLLMCLMPLPAYTQDGLQVEPASQAPSQQSLAEISRQLENPLSSLWAMVFQYNLSVQQGDAVKGAHTSHTTFFQPAMPVPIGDDYIFIARPVFPLVKAPDRDSSKRDGVDGKKTGLGDIQLLGLLGPNRKDGLIWGVGPTFKLPTASDDALGQGKYQAGPAAMLFYMGKPWVGGILAQHWWSFAGDDDRRGTSQTDIQYVLRRSFPGAWSLGMGPTLSINWKAQGGDMVTLPIGLGITKTIRIGKMPVKLRFEPQYSVIRPNKYGTRWNFRIQIAPVIPSPFRS